MKRYMIFAYDRYACGGGMNDFKGDYETLDEAKEALEESQFDIYDYAIIKEIYDLETKSFVDGD